MDETLRKQAAAIFQRLGLAEDEAITLFYKRTVAAGKLPFAAAGECKKNTRKKKRMNERFAEWDAPFIKYAYVYDDNGSPVKAVDVEFSA